LYVVSVVGTMVLLTFNALLLVRMAYAAAVGQENLGNYRQHLEIDLCVIAAVVRFDPPNYCEFTISVVTLFFVRYENRAQSPLVSITQR
jgi:hypothetical protein